MPRPRSLSQDDLATAALAVLDRDGLTGLSMRTVAVELGMSTMALYRYVSDRDELELLVVDLVLGAVDTTPPPDDRPWAVRIALLADRLRKAVSAHPNVIPLTPAHRHHSVGILRWGEAILSVLADAGFTGEGRVIALRAVSAYVIGAIQLEHLGPLQGPGAEAIAGQNAFPLMAETARHARKVGTTREFRAGLAALLAGLPGSAGE